MFGFFHGYVVSVEDKWDDKFKIARQIIRLLALPENPSVGASVLIDQDVDSVARVDFANTDQLSVLVGRRGTKLVEREFTIAANALDILRLRDYPIEPREGEADREIWDRQPWYMNFWRRWYEGFVNGRPLDWDLQREVALIPDEDWEKGPEHIARLIEQIEARFDVRIAAYELEAQLEDQQAQASPPPIGHNNPPETIFDAGITRAEFEELKSAVRILKTQSEAARADAGVVESAAEAAEGVLTKILSWLAVKAGMDFDAFRKGFWGTAGGAAFIFVTGSLTPLLQGLRTLLAAVEAWLPLLVETLKTVGRL